jgi:Tol biopolymer transport system component/tRNA A-37 threonylcarbamoyl transferase component Bud32
VTLTSGARLGPYEVQSPIGAGGMGEVYRARDTRLDRAVAIKLLPASFVDRPDRRQRFRIEARAISSLQHPHICTLFDVGEQDGQVFLVLEYLEGETLDDRLVRGPLRSAEVLLYATQIASALDHAHRAQIVHRDLKPSNVMLTESGTKLLDFGLAMGPALSPTATSTTVSFAHDKLTVEGMLVGTFQYMAPEQLEGKQADARTDIFALGAVLYEMATGRKAFAGDSQASLIASILTAHPPAMTSGHPALDSDSALTALEHVVERCLAKNPDERWQTMRDVKLELDWIAKGSTSTRAPALIRRRLRWREAAAWTVALVAVVAAAALGFIAFRTTPVVATRFVVSPPEGTTMWVAESRTQIAISPDGRRLAMIVTRGGSQQIWIRSLDTVTAEPLASTDGAISPFWSPDSRFVGFFSPGEGVLKKVEITGGPARTIIAARVDGVPTWGADGTILYTQFLDGIYRVSADGGKPTRVTQIDKSKRELNHYWPQFLPGGKFLYMATALEPTGFRSTPSVYVASFDSPTPTLLTQVHSRMTYADPGYLLSVQDGTLMAQRFDSTSLRLVGEPTRVADGLLYLRTIGNASFAVSANGVLAYQGAGTGSRVVWSDRRGNLTDTGWTTQAYGALEFSPDGERVAVDVADPRTGTGDIWIADASRGAPVRFTSDPEDQSRPVWAPDGSRVLFRSNRGGPESLRIGSAAPNLYVRAVSDGNEEMMVGDLNPVHPEDWSRDNRWIAYTRNTQQTGADIWLMPLGKGAKPFPFSNERFIERDARFSPDSRWVAFVTTEAGPPEVYVAPVGQSGARRRISVGGGTTPRWSRNSRELFYVAADNRTIMQVPIESGSTFVAGVPTRLFSIGPSSASSSLFAGIVYDVSPDGRFLISIPEGQPAASVITVVLNWTSVLHN